MRDRNFLEFQMAIKQGQIASSGDLPLFQDLLTGLAFTP
jgi:hypothetical protein